MHKADCVYLPKVENRHYLGEHASCHTAVAAARVYYPAADGCKYCSKECHNS